MIYLLLLTTILAPAYVIRFSLFHLPQTLLMVLGVFYMDHFCALADNKKTSPEFYKF